MAKYNLSIIPAGPSEKLDVSQLVIVRSLCVPEVSLVKTEGKFLSSEAKAWSGHMSDQEHKKVQ